MLTIEQMVRLPAWRGHAACAGHADLFYGELDIEQRIAVAVCQSCGVREACLAEGLAEERLLGAISIHGVRGGLTPGERRALLR